MDRSIVPELLLRRCAVVVYTILEAYYNMGIGKRHALTFSSCHQPIYTASPQQQIKETWSATHRIYIILYRVHQQQDHDRHQRASRLRPYRVISETSLSLKTGPYSYATHQCTIAIYIMLAGVVQPCSRLNKGYRCEINTWYDIIPPTSIIIAVLRQHSLCVRALHLAPRTARHVIYTWYRVHGASCLCVFL